MWNSSISGANTGASFHAQLEEANRQRNQSNNNIDVERTTNPATTPVPAWFNWHRYQPQDRFPTPKSRQGTNPYNGNENYNPHNPSLLGSASATPNKNKQQQQQNQQHIDPSVMMSNPRPGAPREVTSRTPIFERGGAFDPSSNTSFHHQMTPSSIRKTTTVPNERNQLLSSSSSNNNNNNNNQQHPRNLDQDQWMRQFGAMSSASSIVDTRTTRNPATTTTTTSTNPSSSSQITADMFDRFDQKNNEHQQALAKRINPSHVTFIDDENKAYALASRLPGDRNKRRQDNDNENKKNYQHFKQPILLEEPEPNLPWVPSTHSALAHQQMMKRLEWKIEQERDNKDKNTNSNNNTKLERGEKLFIVNVITDPLRLGTVGSNYNQTMNEMEHHPSSHPKESGPRGLLAASTTTSNSGQPSKMNSRSGSIVSASTTTNNNNNRNQYQNQYHQPISSSTTSTTNDNNNKNKLAPSLEKSSHVVLRNIKAKTVRGFAEEIEKALALEHDIHLKFDDGFRFSNLMQNAPWRTVKSLVGDELLKESRLQQQHQRALNSTSGRTPLTTFFNDIGDDNDDNTNDNDPSLTNGDRVLRAVSKAAAAAAGSISFYELPTELTICPFPSKRRLAFHITLTTLHPAGVSVFPLKEEDVILERRGSAWVSDMDQLRQAIGRITHRDCSKAPMFLLSNASAEDVNEKMKQGDTTRSKASSSSMTSLHRFSSSPTKTTIKSHEIGKYGLPKCEPLLGPHQLPPFSSILVSLDSPQQHRVDLTSSKSANNNNNNNNRNNSSSSSFTFPDELGSTASFSLGLPKRIKTPLAAAVIGDEDNMLMSFDNFVQTAKANGGNIPLKREEMLFSGDDEKTDPYFKTTSEKQEIERRTDPRHRSHTHAMKNAADDMMDEFKKKFNPDGSLKFNNNNSKSNKDEKSQIAKELEQQPARANVNLIEHVISEGMARFGDYIEAGQIKVPKVFPNKINSSTSENSEPIDENDPERSDTPDEASRALLFTTDDPTLRPIQRYDVPKTRFRRALLQASMHLLRTAKDADVLSTDALVRSTSDIVDMVLRELEQKYGYGSTRPFQLPLGTHEISTIRQIAGRAVQLEIAVQTGLTSNHGRSGGGAFMSKDPASIARVNAERELMGLRPLPNANTNRRTQQQQQFPPSKKQQHASSPGNNDNNNNNNNDNFFEMPVDSPSSRALASAVRSGDEQKQEELSTQLGLPSYEALPNRKPLDGAVLVLTRPQFDLLTKRIVVFATCSVDIFSVQSAINAMRFHRRSQGAHELQKTSEASFFRWCVAYGQHSAQSFQSYLKNKDAGSLEGHSAGAGRKSIREVPLDALIELGLARVDIVSFARPTTLALEISLRRPPTAEGSQQQQQQDNNNNEQQQQEDNNNNNNNDTTIDVLQADERYSVYLEVGDDEGGFVHQALTFILPTSVLHPEQYAEEQRRKSELRRGGKVVPQFEEM